MVCAFLTKHVKSCESLNTHLSVHQRDDSSLQTSTSIPGIQEGGELITIILVLIIPTDADTEEPGPPTVAPTKEGNPIEGGDGTMGFTFTQADWDQPTGSGMLPPHLREEATTSTAFAGDPEEAQTTPGTEEEHMTTEPEDNDDNKQGKKKTVANPSTCECYHQKTINVF